LKKLYKPHNYYCFRISLIFKIIKNVFHPEREPPLQKKTGSLKMSFHDQEKVLILIDDLPVGEGRAYPAGRQHPHNVLIKVGEALEISFALDP